MEKCIKKRLRHLYFRYSRVHLQAIISINGLVFFKVRLGERQLMLHYYNSIVVIILNSSLLPVIEEVRVCISQRSKNHGLRK